MAEAPKQRKRKRAVLEAVQDDGNSKFARALGSVDYQTREKGLQALTTWLSKRNDISEQELKRLWKGLFYCFWHADKAAFQADLATRLAEILPVLPPNTAFLYFSVFLDTMRREWFGIDRLRLDKFMMLVRKFMHAVFQHLQTQEWETGLVSRFMDCLQSDLMLSSDRHPAAGLMYHLADIFVVELREVCRGAAPDARVLQSLLEPFCQVMAKTQRAPFLPRLREGFFDVLIQEVTAPSEKMPFKHLATDQLADHLFQLGALPETKGRNRQELYDTSKALAQAVKKSLRQQGKANGSATKLAGNAFAVQPQVTAKFPVSRPGIQHRADNAATGTAAVNSPAVQNGPSEAAEEDVAVAKAQKRLLKKQKKAAAAQAEVLSAVQTVKKAKLAAPTTSEQQPAMAPSTDTTQLSNRSLKKRKKRKASDKPVAEPAFTMPDSAEEGSPVSAGITVKRRKHKAAVAATDKVEAALPAAAAEPAAASVQIVDAVRAPAGQGLGSTQEQPAAKKHRVRFAMKRNLLMQIGGAVPPQDVRTPPGSRPKGSALKRSSLATDFQPGQSSGSGNARGSKGSASSLKSLRAQAKLFF